MLSCVVVCNVPSIGNIQLKIVNMILYRPVDLYKRPDLDNTQQQKFINEKIIINYKFITEI